MIGYLTAWLAGIMWLILLENLQESSEFCMVLCLCRLSFSFSSVFVVLSSFGLVVRSRSDPQLSLNSFLDCCSCGSSVALTRELLIFTYCHIHTLDPISRASQTCLKFIYIYIYIYIYIFRVYKFHVHTFHIPISHIYISCVNISRANFAYRYFE